MRRCIVVVSVFLTLGASMPIVFESIVSSRIRNEIVNEDSKLRLLYWIAACVIPLLAYAICRAGVVILGRDHRLIGNVTIQEIVIFISCSALGTGLGIALSHALQWTKIDSRSFASCLIMASVAIIWSLGEFSGFVASSGLSRWVVGDAPWVRGVIRGALCALPVMAGFSSALAAVLWFTHRVENQWIVAVVVVSVFCIEFVVMIVMLYLIRWLFRLF